ncbi:MAG: glycosyltransferase family 4 protein [Planctomycetota bacterium]
MILENCGYPEDTRVRMEAESLDNAGYQVSMVCPTGETNKFRENVNGIEVYRYPAPPEIGGFIGYVFEFAYSLIAAFLFSSWITITRGVDAFHVHSPPDINSLVPIPFRLLGKRFVLDTHDLSPELYDAQKGGQGKPIVAKTLRWFERLSCRWADRLIATNESQKEVQIERGGANRAQCYVVRNGPNQRFLEPTEPIPELALDDRLTLGYVGMIGIQDGVDKFIEAMVVLRQRRQDFVGVIVGDGPATDDLKSLVQKHAISDQVRFTGMVEFDDVPRYIAAFDIAITPDPSNAYNDSCTTIKTMEYMALSKPTVSFETRENQLTAADSAFYASDNDPATLADCIERLMDSPAERERMGQLGRQRIVGSLAWEHQKWQLISLYDDLFPHHHPARCRVTSLSADQDRLVRPLDNRDQTVTSEIRPGAEGTTVSS